jgi:hypothetical protein
LPQINGRGASHAGSDNHHQKGEAVAKLIPVKKPASKIFGGLAGKIEIVGDVESPVISPQTWEMLR